MGSRQPEPAPPLHTIARRRLSALFRHASRARVTLCTAPAGYGKTIALNQFLGRKARNCARVTLAERSGGLFNFVRELASGLSALLSRPELTLSAVYDRVAISETPDLDLARWLVSELPAGDVAIVVDNLDRVAADAQVVRFLDRVIRDAPNLRWFLLSRTTGSLPLPNWMADGLLDLPIDQNALAFTSGEVAALSERYAVTSANADLLTEAVHGWPLGIAMRVRYGEAFDAVLYDRRNPAGAYRALLDLCFRRCTDRERDLLLDTALMYRLYPAALRALGWRDGARLLRGLNARFPLFFSGTANAHTHDDLMRTYLLERLRDRGHEAVDAAIERCGRALEEAGHPGEALALYVEQNASRLLVALLERHGFRLVDSGSANLVNEALDALPNDSGMARPVTLALRGSYESRLGRYDVAEAWYVHALKQSTGELHDEIAYRYACDLLRRQRPDCISLLEGLAERTRDAAMLANARSALAQAYFLEDRVEDARRLMREAVAALDRVESVEVLSRTLGRAAYVCLYSDDLHAASEFGRRAVQLAVPARQYVVAIGALSVLYSVACEWGRVDDALAHLNHLAQLSTTTGNLDFQLYAIAGSYELYAERYDVQGIERCETALQSFDLHYDTSTTLEAVLPARALQYTWRGEFERAYALLAPSASQQRGAEWKAQRHAELALYAAACEQRDDARRELEGAVAAIGESRAGTHMGTQAQIVMGIAYSLLGERRQAERFLAAAGVDLAPYDRLGRLFNAARELHKRWSGEPNHAALIETLNALYPAGFGGFARMLEQIPMPVAVRSLLARAKNSDEFGSAQLLALLDRYPEVSLSG